MASRAHYRHDLEPPDPPVVIDEPHGAADRSERPLAGVVAVVGCDGTGKTTLVADLIAILQQRGPAQRRYMGLISGEAGDRIKRLPMIGIRLERYLAAKSRRAQDMEKRLSGVLTAIVMYCLSVWRVAKVRRLTRLAQSGVLVIAERYPQAEIPGFHYDGPGLTVDRTDNWFIRKLAMRELRLYEWMARHRPAAVIRLTIDADTAYARKPDHPLSELRDKIAVMPHITYNGAEIREIDARRPYPRVLADALRAVDAAIGV
jgi:thymidylate kinase